MTNAEKARQARLATFFLLALIMLVLALETLLLAPSGMQAAALLFVMGLKLLPLAFFLRPLWQGRTMSAIWLGLLLTVYFCWAVLAAYAPAMAGKLALLQAILIAACFMGAMLFVRWQRAAESG